MTQNSKAGPVVIKVGGSLLDWPELPGRLAAFLARLRGQDPPGAGRLLLIPGGGATADVVRTMDRIHDLGETRAHWLAIRAMDFTAELLAALLPQATVVSRPEELSSNWNIDMIPVLAPRRMLEEIDSRGLTPLPENWDVTSDSIAARIAIHLTARRLILLKSKAVRAGTTRDEATRLGLVDPVFPAVARELEIVEVACLRDDEPRTQVLCR
jgi:5-(aminomethyl)-3-furanmethanol phosphate kinase